MAQMMVFVSHSHEDDAFYQVLVAWTGTDAAHHLNVARIGV